MPKRKCVFTPHSLRTHSRQPCKVGPTPFAWAPCTALKQSGALLFVFGYQLFEFQNLVFEYALFDLGMDYDDDDAWGAPVVGAPRPPPRPPPARTTGVKPPKRVKTSKLKPAKSSAKKPYPRQTGDEFEDPYDESDDAYSSGAKEGSGMPE